ncbi:hypothetical protein C8T65DRAFT_826160 [Cerioporus squamosus]|nr:hypothetical protein C8T65DRAFT_826160 [Cerioporus squamosus]
MARRARKARKIEAVKSEEDAKTTPRTITDLPPELLHMLFSHLREYRYTIEACTMVCRLLRDIAVEYLVFKRPRRVGDLDHLDHFLSFMRRHPRPSKTVQSLTLFDMPLNGTLVREITQLFPNLKSLELSDISCTPPSPYHHPQSDSETSVPAPMQLGNLVLDCTRARAASSGWTLSGMMHILSLFHPKELIVWMKNGARFRDTFEPACLAESPAVQDLRVLIRESEIPRNRKSIANVLDALSRTLAPGVLQSVTVRYDSKATLRALSTLLKRIGENVKALTIHGPAPRCGEKRQIWVDPFDDLGVREAREDRLSPLYIRPREEQRALSYVVAGLLANYAPRTLRKVTIDVRYIQSARTLEDMEVLDLQEFDKVLTQARFPNLQRFDLDVSVSWGLMDTAGYMRQCCEAARRALPDLHSRGILKVQVEEPW